MKAQRGFSLLEVLLAFVLLASSLAILFAILGGGMTQVRQAGDATTATLHAQSLLAPLGMLEPIEPGRDSGTLEGGRYRWELDIAETDPPLPLAGPDGEAPPESVGRQLGQPLLYHVRLDIAWGEGDDARTLRFDTLRARIPETPLEGVVP